MQVDKENKTTSLSRIINSPIEKVWDAYTVPELLEKWWGPRKYQTIVKEFDFKVGGTWKMINRGDEGDFVFFGKFLEIENLNKIVWTFSFEGMEDKELSETMLFEKVEDEKTRITSIGKYETIEDLQAMVESGMESGALESWDKLEELLAQ